MTRMLPCTQGLLPFVSGKEGIIDVNKYIFYLRPPTKQVKQLSLVYFSVFTATSLQQAAHAFSAYYRVVYCGFLQLSQQKAEVYFVKNKQKKQIELVYVVIEEHVVRDRQA